MSIEDRKRYSKITLSSIKSDSSNASQDQANFKLNLTIPSSYVSISSSIPMNKLSSEISTGALFTKDILKETVSRHIGIYNSEMFVPEVSREKLQIENRLSIYENHVVICAFNEVMEQLNIIKNYLPYPKFDWEKAYEYPDVYIMKISGKMMDDVFPPYHEYENSPLWKVQLDRFVVQKIIEETKCEVGVYGTYTALNDFLLTMDYVKKQEDIVYKENYELKKVVADLKKVVAPKLIVASSENQVEDIFASEDEMMLDERIKMGIQERYIDAWEKARVDQNMMKILKEENDLSEKLENFEIAQNMENRINTEISTYLLYETTELERMITEWTNRYNKELETEDTILLQLNSEKETLETKMKNLVTKFHQQGEEIETLQKFFEDYEREQEIRSNQIKAASLIQYWWRKYLAVKREALAKLKKGKKK